MLETVETVEAAQEAAARRQEGRGATGQDSGGRYGRQEAGGGPHLQHRTCPAPACTSLLALTHCSTAGALAGVSPSCLCSHAPSCSWAGWLLVCCYYGLLLDGWLPPSFEPDLPGQSCLTTSSNQIGLDGVQGTAWGCTSQWPEVGGVSVSCQKFEPLVMEMEEHGQFGGVPERLARRERVCRICCIWSTWRRTKLP
ncbi:hypothetical protein BDP67DRAFT_567864 [Colletotrichum lupini]|nr:hypothetical protein BDP67DRAFT_567864 [Colletotrichum lupini]